MLRSFATEWNQTPVFIGFLRESRRREILHRPRLRLFILNLLRREVEIVARVYRAIFDPFLHCRLTIRHCPLLSPIHPRRNSLQQHSRPSPSIIYHFETSKMLLSTPVLEKFHPQSLQSQAQAPGSWNSATILNCCDAFGKFSECPVDDSRNSRCESNCKSRGTIDIIHCRDKCEFLVKFRK